MPREYRRSLGYRFITCDDPNGVVECGSIRLSRGKYREMEAVIENPRKMKSPIMLRKNREAESGRRSDGSGGSGAAQLSEVSRGAQELNRMIETWSRRGSFDRQSKDIAKDLLKGALDLQESLILLGKLQEATKYVAQLKQREEKSEDPWEDARFQEPRISVVEALGTHKLRRKGFDPICDVPSTSSSQSSILNGDDAAYYAESGAFSTAITQQGSARRSNVIAKLMGLEEIPSKNRIDGGTNSQWKKPTFNMDADKFSKPRFEVPSLGREPRSLKKILEGMQSKGMQSKGLLRSDSVRNRKLGNDDHPPIVLIKPFASPVVKEGILRTEVTLKTAKLKEEMSRRFSDRQGKIDRSERSCARNEVKGYEPPSGRRSKVSKKSPTSDAVDRKPGEAQKFGKNSGRCSEGSSHSRVSFSDPQRQDYKELTATRLVRTEHSGPNKMKNQTSAPLSGTQKNVPNRRILEGHRKKSIDHIGSPKVKLITVVEKKDISQNEIPAVDCEKIDDENDVSRRIEADPVTTEANSSSTVTSMSVEETDQTAAFLRLQEDSKNKQSDSGYAKPATSDNKEIGDLDSEHDLAFTKRSSEKALLRSDSAFLAPSEDLLESFGIYPTILRSVEKDQPRSVCEKLYLDFANEFIERKNLQIPRNLHPISFTSRGNGPSLMSVDELVEEVSNGINDLNGWCEFADGHLSADGFYALLERDMWSKGFANGTWEFGWRDGFSRKDVERVASEVEKMVLGWLIEEAITGV